jgi:SAM-dependent methyltransferase
MMSVTDFFLTIKYLPFLILRNGNYGYCPICQKRTLFIKFHPWLRDNYKCINCQSIPRWRALIIALNFFYPSWQESEIHESSPGGRSSDFIRKKCKKYSNSFYFPDAQLGSYKNGNRCENLENTTFDDETFDIFITQDVFEHINHPNLAFKEIARVLKPGGMHFFTVPLYRNLKQTRPRIVENNGEIQYLLDPVYHDNPIDEKGSLVTVDYGLDLPDFIFKESKLTTTIFLQKDISQGLDAEFLEVFISKKIETSPLI